MTKLTERDPSEASTRDLKDPEERISTQLLPDNDLDTTELDPEFPERIRVTGRLVEQKTQRIDPVDLIDLTGEKNPAIAAAEGEYIIRELSQIYERNFLIYRFKDGDEEIIPIDIALKVVITLKALSEAWEKLSKEEDITEEVRKSRIEHSKALDTLSSHNADFTTKLITRFLPEKHQ